MIYERCEAYDTPPSNANVFRVKATPRSPNLTVKKSAMRTVCPTPSVIQTPNTCLALWRLSTGTTQLPALLLTHTHTFIQATKQKKYLRLRRLLKAMGWQEYPENDDNFLPLTEDELREFQTKTEQVSTSRRVRDVIRFGFLFYTLDTITINNLTQVI